MTIRLTLLTVPEPARPTAGIADDGSLDERDRLRVRSDGGALSPFGRQLAAPSRRCRETAEVLGLDPVVDGELRALDLGSWRGRTLEDVARADSAALEAWTSDPDAAPHGGESIRGLCLRIADWLDRLPQATGPTLALVDASVARAAVVHALAAAPQAFWRIDVMPLSRVQLTGRAGRWNLRL